MARWWSYVLGIISPDSPATAAHKAGVNPTTFTRWKQGTVPDAKHVVALAKAYGESPLEALVAAGVLTGDDVREAGAAKVPLSDVPLAELLDEVRVRLVELEDTFGDLGVLGSVKKDKRLRGEKAKRRLLR